MSHRVFTDELPEHPMSEVGRLGPARNHTSLVNQQRAGEETRLVPAQAVDVNVWILQLSAWEPWGIFLSAVNFWDQKLLHIRTW